ncbi:MAG: hemolysin family protein [Candidatus Komeilibacteria bacterium]|nr:hemolysin family protein [Candidatus Komeilibacteria bacterium]
MLWEIVIVFILTILNGFFSMSEIALITVRKTHIAALAKQGNGRAKVIQNLQQNPEGLFATIQIGISVITIAASAFAGASIAEDLAGLFNKAGISFIAEHSYAISFTIVVALLSYVSITIGELIPKSLGLRYSEPMALLAAYPIWWLSKISGWLIKLFSATSNAFLKLFNDTTTFTESRLSEEEIRNMILEGHKGGAIDAHENNIIQNVFDFSDLSVDKIMVPRARMFALDVNLPAREVALQAIESGYSRIPVYQGSINNITGVLYTKKLLSKFDEGSQNLNMQEFLVPPYFVPDTMKISEVLQRLQRKKAHMALVTNEHGEIEGLITMEDILEEIVGDITDETDEADEGIRPEGDDFIVAGNVSVVDFNKYFKTDLPEDEDYSTVSGFILDRLGRFPQEGDVANHNNLKLTVTEVTLRTVKNVIVKNIKAEEL